MPRIRVFKFEDDKFQVLVEKVRHGEGAARAAIGLGKKGAKQAVGQLLSEMQQESAQARWGLDAE